MKDSGVRKGSDVGKGFGEGKEFGVTGEDGWRKKTASILLPFAVYFVAHDLASVLFAFLVGVGRNAFGEGYWGFVEEHSASVHGILNGLSLCTGMAAVWLLAKGEVQRGLCGAERRKDGSMCGGSCLFHGTGIRLADYALLVVCAAALAVGMNLLLTLTGLTGMSENYTEISARQYGVPFWLGLLLYGVVSPVAEETVFRGVIYQRMRRYFRAMPAVLLCGILFGFYHGNLVQGVYGCVLGIAITLVCEWYGSLWASVLFHGAANTAVFAVSYGKEAFGGAAASVWCAGLLMAAAAAGIFMGKMRCGKGEGFGNGKGSEKM